MPKKTTTSNMDNSFRTLFVVVTIIDGFLFSYGGGQQSELMFTFYFGLNFVPIIILALIWWFAIFFDKIVWKLFGWFMLFNLIMQSFLLLFVTFFPSSILFLFFPFTPLIVAPIEIIIYRRYIKMGEHLTRKQSSKVQWLCTLYSIVQFVWFMVLFLWLVAMVFVQILELFDQIF